LPLAPSGFKFGHAGRTPLGGAEVAGPGGRGVVGGVRGGVGRALSSRHFRQRFHSPRRIMGGDRHGATSSHRYRVTVRCRT
jgi:hypothetical protein